MDQGTQYSAASNGEEQLAHLNSFEIAAQSNNFSDPRPYNNMQDIIMRQTAPPEMVMGSLHYVHDLASFDQVRRNQTREGPPDHGFRAIPLTAGQAG